MRLRSVKENEFINYHLSGGFLYVEIFFDFMLTARILILDPGASPG